MAIHAGVRFSNARVHFDNERFFNCTFDGCTIVYRATGAVTLDHCKFVNSIFAFEGAAADTVELMTSLYRLSPDAMEQTFDRIRLGTRTGE